MRRPPQINIDQRQLMLQGMTVEERAAISREEDKRVREKILASLAQLSRAHAQKVAMVEAGHPVPLTEHEQQMLRARRQARALPPAEDEGESDEMNSTPAAASAACADACAQSSAEQSS